ncbi:MAG TPA: hypothetical protein VMF57_21870 [Solirubrobacteraceae bacterium]|nr:hypothetical protein [Solirubrobacteraceae bacterium]
MAALLTVVALVPALPTLVPAAVAEPAPAGSRSTIDDLALGVTWLANADLPATMKLGLTSQIDADGSMTYRTAVEWVRRLNRRDYLGHRNWTLR